MNNNILSGERTSFFKLFSEKKYKISIPILQRDYAQGRESEKEVRITFLQSLYKYLDDGIANRDLDFIYGTLESDEDNCFIPLDGQQRLTTLFLLHWYLYQLSSNQEAKKYFKNIIVKDDRSLFTYETRTSSSDFCNMLMSVDIDFNNLATADDNKNNEFSKTVENLSDFYLSWKYDPTIISMLNMLDSIHLIFNNRNDFFELLLDEEQPVITFLFLNLNEFKLTDELYVKMNSRGKPLTRFENFKAKFEQFLDGLVVDRKFTLNFDGVEKEVSLGYYFSHNIDTKWAKTLWGYRHLIPGESEKYETFDDELMNYIRIVLTYQYATNRINLGTNSKLEYLLGTLVAKKNNKDYSDDFTFHKFEELEALDIDGILLLIDSLDALCIKSGSITTYLNSDDKFYYNEEDVFNNVLCNTLGSNHQRLCFYAYIKYLSLNTNLVGIEQWMRVIHNLTHPENTVIDESKEVISAIASINKLLPHSNNILHYLTEDNQISAFSNWQILEERIKSHLILRDKKWKDAIETLEKHRYFNGQIGFVLNFSGILQYYENNGNCNWSEDDDVQFFTLLTNYSDKASVSFADSYDNRVNDQRFIFERAVLTKGNYLTKSSWPRYNLLSTNLVKNNIKRDHSWKRVLRINSGQSQQGALCVKALFDDPRFDKDNLHNSLSDICNDRVGDWRDYFIDCDELITYCKQGFIRYENDDTIRLYGESQSNHIHVEMYTYYVWKKFVEHRKLAIVNNRELTDRDYYEVKSIEDNPCIIYGRFLFERIYYQLEVYYWEHECFVYEINFVKSYGERSFEKYNKSLTVLYENMGFEWDENERFIIKYYTIEDLLKGLDTLDTLLNNI